MLAGEGDHFCSGLDLSELSARDAAQGIAHSRSWHRAFEHIEFGKVPVVAVLHGAVVGGGLEIAAACHIRVAEGSAYYALPEGSRGIFVGGGGSVRLPRLIGTSRMMDMMLTGRSYDAEEGQAIGISHYLVAPGEGLAKGIELAKRIAGNAPMTNFAVTQVLPRIAESDPATGYLTEALISAIAQADGEAKSRLKAFLEKRAPKVVHKKPAQTRLAQQDLTPSDAPWRHRSKSVVPKPPRRRRCGRCASARATWSVERRPRRHHPPQIAPRARALPGEADRAARTLGRDRARAGLPGAARCQPAAGASSPMRETLEQVRRIGAALLQRELSPERPIAILSGNDIEHALRRPRRHVCRHPLRADLARLFAHLAGFRQAALDHRAAHAGSRLRRRRRALPRARSRRSCRPTSRSSSAATRCRAGRPRCCRRCWRRPRLRRPTPAHARGRARHHRQVPVHLGLDRHAESGDQHPAHVVREPGDDPLAARVLRRTSRR